MTTNRCQCRQGYAGVAEPREQCRLWQGHGGYCRFDGEPLSLSEAQDMQAAQRRDREALDRVRDANELVVSPDRSAIAGHVVGVDGETVLVATGDSQQPTVTITQAVWDRMVSELQQRDTRVKELEALLEFQRIRAPGVIDRLEEDLARKREECDRLELQLRDASFSVEHLDSRLRGCQSIIGEQRLEIEKLQRQLRKAQSR